MAENYPITPTQREKLDVALAQLQAEGEDITARALARVARVASGPAQAYRREVEARAAAEQVIPDAPQDPAIATALLSAIWPAAYEAARAMVADELAQARERADSADDAAAEADDAARKAAVRADQAEERADLAEQDRDTALQEAKEANQRAAEALQTAAEAETRRAAAQDLVDGQKDQLDRLTEMFERLTPRAQH